MNAHRFRIFRSRSTRLFLGGQFVSVTGTWMQSVAQSWLVYRLTGSAWWLGAVHFSSQFPVMLLAPVGGLLADRYPRKRIVMVCQSLLMIQAAVLAALTLTHAIQPWHIAGLAVSLGFINAFEIPARQSLVAEIPDDPTDMPSIIAANASIFNGARVLGPTLAGVAVAAFGEGLCFLINSVSFLAVLAALSFVTPHPHVPAVQSGWRAIREGWQFARATLNIRRPLFFLGFSSFAGMAYTILLPLFANQLLGGGPKLFGFLTGAIGVGAVTATLSFFFFQPPPATLKRLLGWATLAFGLTLMLFAQSRWIPLSLLAAFALGLSQVTIFVGTNTWIQTHVPDEFRGRIISLYSMMVIGMTPLGGLALGHFASTQGPSWTLAASGGLTTIAALLYGWSFSWRDTELRTKN